MVERWRELQLSKSPYRDDAPSPHLKLNMNISCKISEGTSMALNMSGRRLPLTAHIERRLKTPLELVEFAEEEQA